MKLVIAEKPSVAQSLAKVMNDSYVLLKIHGLQYKKHIKNGNAPKIGNSIKKTKE